MAENEFKVLELIMNIISNKSPYDVDNAEWIERVKEELELYECESHVEFLDKFLATLEEDLSMAPRKKEHLERVLGRPVMTDNDDGLDYILVSEKDDKFSPTRRYNVYSEMWFKYAECIDRYRNAMNASNTALLDIQRVYKSFPVDIPEQDTTLRSFWVLMTKSDTFDRHVPIVTTRVIDVSNGMVIVERTNTLHEDYNKRFNLLVEIYPGSRISGGYWEPIGGVVVPRFMVNGMSVSVLNHDEWNRLSIGTKTSRDTDENVTRVQLDDIYSYQLTCMTMDVLSRSNDHVVVKITTERVKAP